MCFVYCCDTYVAAKNMKYFFNVFVNCPILNKFGVPRQILEKAPNLRFHENNFGESCTDASGQSDGWTW